MKTAAMVTLVIVMAVPATAQVIAHEPQAKIAAEKQSQLLLEGAPAGRLHMTLETRAVPNAPYTAEAVTETLQVLADGNRISRRNVVRIYRDNAGRTRREMLGPDGEVETVTISDPSKGISHMLHPASQTSHQTQAATMFASSGEGGATVSHMLIAGDGEKAQIEHAHMKAVAEKKVQIETKVAQARQPAVQSTLATSGPVSWISHSAVAGIKPTVEDLGPRTIEGVMAKGTRSTTVIPAGAVGNEQPITVVAEEWFSPDLKVLVMTKHADPRTGETTYRLTNIVRSEPDPSLFERPASYTVK